MDNSANKDVKKNILKENFPKEPSGLSGYKKTLYAVVNIFLIILSTVSLCICSLSLAYGPGYPDGVFFGYFENPLIFLLNYIPVLGLFIVLYAIFGKSWIAYIVESAAVVGFTLANFFLLKFRDDPLMFSDILYFREAIQISSEGYNYELTGKMIVIFVMCVLFTVLLFLFQRYLPKLSVRYYAIVLVFTLSLLLKDVYLGISVYDNHTDNYENVIQWSPTQKYVAKGFVYPFLHSIGEVIDIKPDGYNAGEIKELLSQYTQKDIADEKKVNVIGIMLEAYCDLTSLGIEGIDDSVYSLYRQLKDNGYSGTLVTNIFAAGTIDSERAFLTGYPDITNYRRNVNSYVRYFASQGYVVDGSHPSEYWFYNRQNSNKYLGFETYRFAENYFIEKYGDMMRADSLVFDDFYEHYQAHTEQSDEPYFGFHVTYQGHAPYETNTKLWGTTENALYTAENVSFETDCILNNYLGSVKDTSWRLWQFVEKIQKRDEPCVLVIFGDHKPWLGDGNSVYDELGINIDVSTKEGFLNYYSTEYVIFANNAAKTALGDELVGKGPVTSPCFLMNVLLEKLGGAGDSFMQYTDTVRKEIPVVNETGIIDKNGTFYLSDSIPDGLLPLYKQYKAAAYYRSTTFEE